MPSPEQYSFIFDDWRVIPLTQGKVALVDAAAYDYLMQWKWQYNAGYAVRTIHADGKYHRLLMHRLILGLEFGDKRQVDHIEPAKTLDNRRSNLRIADKKQNGANARISKRNTSGFKGVSWFNRLRKWRAYIAADGKQKHLGYYDRPEDAAAAYMAAAVIHFGEFARGLNDSG